MPDKDRNSGGSLVLDVIGQYHVKTIYTAESAVCNRKQRVLLSLSINVTAIESVVFSFVSSAC